MGADNQAEKVIARIDASTRPFQILFDLRRDGWRVGVHNDYKLNGELMTFWLLTHQAGLFVQGEGKTDLEALTICAEQARKVFAPSP